MTTKLVLVKNAADAKLLQEENKPCYLLVTDAASPKLSYIARYKAPVQLPLDGTQFIAKLDLTQDMNAFMASGKKIDVTTLSYLQKRRIAELTHYTPTNYDHILIIRGINRYLTAQKNNIQANEQGICLGLSALYCKHASQKTKQKFFALLEELTTKTSADLQENASKISSFIQETLHAFRPEHFNSNAAWQDTIENIKVQNPNKNNKGSVSGNLKTAYQISACASENQWLKIMTAIKAENGSYLVSSLRHAISLSVEEGKFNYYDPNTDEGELVFNSETDLLRKIARMIAGHELSEAKKNPGVKVKLSLGDGEAELKYEQEQWYLHQAPKEVKVFQTLKELHNYLNDNYINNNNFLLTLSIDAVENPYAPNPQLIKPNSSELLDELINSGNEYRLTQTMRFALKANNAELANQLLNQFIEPDNTRLSEVFHAAFRDNAYAWLKAVIEHPKVKNHESTRQELIQTLVNSPSLLTHDRCLQIVLAQPSFATEITTEQKASLLDDAVLAHNPHSVSLLLNLCTEEELKKVVSEQLIINAMRAGNIEVLELLRPYHPIDGNGTLLKIGLILAMEAANLKMLTYLLGLSQVPQDSLLFAAQFIQRIDESAKETLLRKAIAARNEAYVAIAADTCLLEEIKTLINDEIIYEAIRIGHIPSLEVLLSKRTINEATVIEGLKHAVLANKPEMITYLLNKFAKAKLIEALHISAEQMCANKITAETFTLLEEKGAHFVASLVNGVLFSAEDTETCLRIYQYAAEPSVQNMNQIRPHPEVDPPAPTVAFWVQMLNDKKIDALRLFKDLFNNEDTLLACAVITRLHAEHKLLPVRDAIQHFMEEMVNERNNTVLKELLELKPLLPLNYAKLHELADKIHQAYKASWWPFITTINPQLIESLKLAAETSSSLNCSTSTMLRVQTENPVASSDSKQAKMQEDKENVLTLKTEDKVELKPEQEEAAPSIRMR